MLSEKNHKTLKGDNYRTLRKTSHEFRGQDFTFRENI